MDTMDIIMMMTLLNVKVKLDDITKMTNITGNKMIDGYYGYYYDDDSAERESETGRYYQNDEYYGKYDEDDYSLYDDQYDYGYNGDIVDDWYDEETASDWVVMMDKLDDDMINLDDDALDWNMVTEGIMTHNGQDLTRKCTNLFGHQICICQFLEMIKVKTNQHLCYPKTSKSKPLKSKSTKKVMTKIGIIGNA